METKSTTYLNVRSVRHCLGRLALVGVAVLTVTAACGGGTADSKKSAVPATIVPAVERAPSDSASPTAEWVAGVNNAGWGFHRHLEGDVVSSPLSIGTAFSLSRAGASSETGKILDDLFGFPTDTHEAANSVDLKLTEASTEPNVVELANALFPDSDFTPLSEFLETAAKFYDVTVQPVDASNSDATVDTINRWVDTKTRGLIPTIVDRLAVRNQQLMLVNTVYLKADWQTPFMSHATSDGEFITGTGQKVSVPFMRDDEPLTRRHVPLDGADAVELPYAGHDLAMWLIVPHEPGGLETVEESLDAATIAGLSQTSQTSLVYLAVPKWEQTLPPTDLFEWLCPQGFCAGAAFDGIAPGIFISKALHGAKIVVDEKGTEAAAVTMMAMESAAPPSDINIVVDRPFLWAIIHQDTQAILFIGRVTNPTT